MDIRLFLDALVQHGFVGLSAALLAILVWLVRRLLALLEETNAVISENTDAIRSLDRRSEELVHLCGKQRDLLLSRPCIAAAVGR